MSTCKYRRYDYTCDHQSDEETDDGFCILHSPKPEKEQETFEDALKTHREQHGDSFIGFVFPKSFTFEKEKFSENADFSGAKFTGYANFLHAEFGGNARFGDAQFSKNADFRDAQFSGKADFFGAKFDKEAYFNEARFGEDVTGETADLKGMAQFDAAIFSEYACFDDAKFKRNAYFSRAEFRGEATFLVTKFSRVALFDNAGFSGDATFEGTEFSRDVSFLRAKFLGRTLFVSGKVDDRTIRIFPESNTDAECDFTNVIIDRPDAIIFRDVDLRKCRFQGTDLRKVEITGAQWPKIVSKKWPEFIRRKWPKSWKRFGVYDEDELEGGTETYPHIEQLYRQLKQNYEDRKDYARASDFHYGEKNMRRKAETAWGLWFWLTLYWLVSGYGERWVRPIVCAVGLLLSSTFCYLRWGLLRFKDTDIPVSANDLWEAGLYGLQVMALLRPTYFEPFEFWGRSIYSLQSIAGPILIGLFALAIRQQLKR